jgi:hypothetical protein
MSDGITIPIDGDDTKIRGKLARVKREAAGAGKAFGQAGAQAARVGGAAGGALGRGIGGFSQGGAAGFLGLGLAGGGMLLSAFLQRDGERQTLARERESRNQGRAADARSVMKAKDDLAAGGLNFLGAARRIISRGNLGKVGKTVGRGQSYGMNTMQSLGALEASESTGVGTEDIFAGMATGLIGESPSEVAGNIQKFNGLNNAVSALTGKSLDEAQQFVDNAALGGLKMKRASGAMVDVEMTQLTALLGGETARVMENQARDTLDPGRKLMLDASQKMMDSVNLQRAAADAQSGVAAMLAEMGRVVGLSEGSAARKLAVGAEAAAE